MIIHRINQFKYHLNKNLFYNKAKKIVIKELIMLLHKVMKNKKKIFYLNYFKKKQNKKHKKNLNKISQKFKIKNKLKLDLKVEKLNQTQKILNLKEKQIKLLRNKKKQQQKLSK